MPAIRQIYFKHPQTGKNGLWLHLTGRKLGIVGKTATQIAALVPGGTVATRLTPFEVTLNATLQRLCEDWVPLSSLALDDPIVLNHTPEFACRFETVQGVEYHVIPVVSVHVQVLFIKPIKLGGIRVTEAASRSIYL